MRVGQTEPGSSGGLAFTEASHWCAASPFEGIINTFWLLWSSCHRKYNLHQDYKMGGPFLLHPLMLLLPSLPTVPPIALGWPDSKQSTNYSLRHLEEWANTLLVWQRKDSPINTHPFLVLTPSEMFKNRMQKYVLHCNCLYQSLVIIADDLYV